MPLYLKIYNYYQLIMKQYKENNLNYLVVWHKSNKKLLDKTTGKEQINLIAHSHIISSDDLTYFDFTNINYKNRVYNLLYRLYYNIKLYDLKFFVIAKDPTLIDENNHNIVLRHQYDTLFDAHKHSYVYIKTHLLGLLDFLSKNNMDVVFSDNYEIEGPYIFIFKNMKWVEIRSYFLNFNYLISHQLDIY